jgi:hypothetical protein
LARVPALGTVVASTRSIAPLYQGEDPQTDQETHPWRTSDIKRAIIRIMKPWLLRIPLHTSEPLCQTSPTNNRVVHFLVRHRGSEADAAACETVDPDGEGTGRIVDASLFPKIHSANTNLPVLLAAEKWAGAMLEARGRGEVGYLPM